MNNTIYILLTIVLVLVYPIIQYRVINQKWKRICFWIYIPFAIGYISVTIFLVFSSIRTEADLVALRDYSSVANRDALGNPNYAGIGSDIKYNDELTSLLADMYSIEGSQIVMKRGLEAEQRYREIIDKFPKFPFGYYFLAFCLRERGDDEWRFHARQAVKILRMTTQVDGHSRNHDEVLNKISSWLEES